MSCDYLEDIEEGLKLNVLKIFNEVPECVRVGEFYIIEIRVEGKIYSKRFYAPSIEGLNKFVEKIRNLLNSFSCEYEIILYEERVRLKGIYSKTEEINYQYKDSSDKVGLKLGKDLGEISKVNKIKEFTCLDRVCEELELNEGSVEKLVEDEVLISLVNEEERLRAKELSDKEKKERDEFLRSKGIESHAVSVRRCTKKSDVEIINLDDKVIAEIDERNEPLKVEIDRLETTDRKEFILKEK